MHLRAARVLSSLIVAFVVVAPARAPAAAACEWNGIERVVAIGDVHGAYNRFVEILRVAGILDNDLRWAGGRTHVVQLGDVLDRGDDSRKALDLIRRLQRPAEAAGGMWHQLMGNHEVARMLGDLRLVTPAEYAAFSNIDSESTRENYVNTLTRSAGDRAGLLKQTPLGFVEMRQAFGRDGEYGRWLRQLPVAIKIDGLLFVHGGISPAVAPLGCNGINDQVRRELTNDLEKTRATPLASLTARADGPLWYRGLAQEPDTFAPQLTEILAKARARAVIVGHTVTQTNRITTRFDGRVIEIDTGMQPAYIADGRASALEIRGSEATAIYVDRREPVELPRREGSSAPQPAAVRR
jgi:diadenosine tetraphosphatase ApaH/serine/threonine PP2A family protein phosphatase